MRVVCGLWKYHVSCLTMLLGYARKNVFDAALANMNSIIEQINVFRPPHHPLPWELLHSSAKGLIKEMTSEWDLLLKQFPNDERRLTTFLADYPAFFFSIPFSTYFVLSEIRLGADYVIDFVIPQDEASNGMIYKLVEVEPASEAPFKANGDKSARLCHAIDQIENWKRWIKRNRVQAKRLFPCAINKHETALEWQIIIGNRVNSKKWLDKRNEVAREYGIQIRSHDSLTDRIKGVQFSVNNFSQLCCTEEQSLKLTVRNALANPFYKTFGDKVWRALEQDIRRDDHFHVFNADILIKARSYNKHFDMFKKHCSNRKTKLKEWAELMQINTSDLNDLVWQRSEEPYATPLNLF